VRDVLPNRRLTGKDPGGIKERWPAVDVRATPGLAATPISGPRTGSQKSDRPFLEGPNRAKCPVDRTALAAAARELGLVLDEAQLDRFAAFEAALYEANRVMNLTRVPREECWLRHFVDSLLLSPLIPPGAAALDIGSGPGFPAWPLACARPDLQVTAVDSSGKMLGFLRSQQLSNLAAIQARAEEWGVRERFDFVTGRALAPLAIQLELSAAPCKVGGVVVPMRTPADLAIMGLKDFEALGLKLEEVAESTLPGTDVVRVFPIYRKAKFTPKPYPRRWAEMKASPLMG
jgi:16S rRNA (guanine527-N7)-methyltransferase